MAIMEVTKMEVKTTGTLVIPQVYKALYDFLTEEGLAGHDADFPEQFFWESRTQTKGKEYWIWWRIEEGVEFGSDLVKKLIDIDIHGVGMQDTEIMYQGRKLKANKGKFEIILRGRLEVDKGDAWKKGPLGFMRDLFLKRMWQKELTESRLEVVEDMRLIREFAADLIKRPITEIKKETFHPKMGYEREEF